MNQRTLPEAWRRMAEVFRDHAESSIAIAYETCAKDLEEALSAEADQPLTLKEASELGGYSQAHLGRLVREGKIPNAGRLGAPRIARQDIPTKPDWVAPAATTHDIDRTQIVRSAINAGD